jgi:AcrR family transcriptional regulator
MTNSHTDRSEGPWTAFGHIATLSKTHKLPRRERKKIETHDRIHQAALKLFTLKGLEATTVDQITDLADVGKGTFFNYFRSKEQILAHFMKVQLWIVGDALEQVRKGKLVRSALWRGVSAVRR